MLTTSVPNDWEIMSVGDFTVEHKQGYYTKQQYESEGILLARITDLGNPKVNFCSMPKLQISEKDYQAFKVCKGDFLFARSGAIGRYGIVRIEPPRTIFASYLIRFRFNEQVNSYYVGQVYESELTQAQIKAISQGNANININAENIKKLKMLVPPLCEQQKIAEVLSTVDKKIDLIDQKIAETEKLKTGLMQKLFSEGIGVQDSDGNWLPHSEFQDSPFGKIPATWSYDSVRSLVSIKSPKYDPKVETDSFPCIELEHLSQGSGEILGTVNSLNLASTKNCFTKGEVLFGKLRPYLKKFAQPSFQGVCSSEIWVMKTINEEKLHNNFLYFFVQHERFINETNKSCGTKMPRADWKVVSELQLPVPSIDEQLAIANILNCIDTNLGLLKQQKTETQQLKKGLMQKLLTGEWRVPLDNPEAA